jgi:uncharacterized membrane protein YdjX (TVP38/TMEM64 family)
MRLLIRFLTNLDAKAWRAVAVSFLLFGGVGLVFLFGAASLGLKHGGETVERWMGAGLTGPWALVAAVGGFTVLAFLGVPQFVLIAAAVVAFGPWAGFAYSFVGNLVSSVIGFFVGRRFGARLLRDYAGRGVQDFIAMVGRNGFWASLVVRLVPSAPFIVVNMAAGVTPMRFSSFLAGTALGSVPKIALTAFAGNAVVRGLNGGGAGRWISVALAAAVWIGSALWARAWLKRREAARGVEVATALTPPG